MSAEIDAFCEVFRDGRWQSTAPSYRKVVRPLDWDPGCNHELFNMLGCARKPEQQVAPPIAEERGLPNDSCPQLMELYRSEDYRPRFYASWLLLSEIYSYLEQYESELVDYVHVPLRKLIKEIAPYGAPEHIRVVFWLDN